MLLQRKITFGSRNHVFVFKTLTSSDHLIDLNMGILLKFPIKAFILNHIVCKIAEVKDNLFSTFENINLGT